MYAYTFTWGTRKKNHEWKTRTISRWVYIYIYIEEAMPSTSHQRREWARVWLLREYMTDSKSSKLWWSETRRSTFNFLVQYTSIGICRCAHTSFASQTPREISPLSQVYNAIIYTRGQGKSCGLERIITSKLIHTHIHVWSIVYIIVQFTINNEGEKKKENNRSCRAMSRGADKWRVTVYIVIHSI